MTTVDMGRAITAVLFHARMLEDHPYACGPLPERDLKSLAEAAARQVNASTILKTATDNGADPATIAVAFHIAFSALWAAGFKAGAQAAGPAD